ncbi:DMT family transporter [Methylobacterium sp. JK268]
MILGILAALTTGALWGLTFVAPRAVAPFSMVDLAIARYAVFGLASLGLMALDARFRPDRPPARLLARGLALGAIGYVAYFICAARAVHLAGPVIPPLVIGALPVVLGVLGNWRDRDLPWRALAGPLALIGAGLLAVNAAALADSPDLLSRRAVLEGILWSAVALAIWIVYALLNEGAARQERAPAPLPWTGLQGLGAGLAVLPLLPLSSWAGSGWLPAGPLGGEALRFAAWALLLGIPGSWLATWCWVVASRRLSLALAAQLIVSESVFGLIYGILYEARPPTGPELAGAVLIVVGVVAAIRAFERHRVARREGPVAG